MTRLNEPDFDAHVLSLVSTGEIFDERAALELVEALSCEIEIRSSAICRRLSVSKNSIWFERISETFKNRLIHKLMEAGFDNLDERAVVGRLLNFLKFAKFETIREVVQQMKREPRVSLEGLEFAESQEDSRVRFLLYECIDKLPGNLRTIFLQMCANPSYSEAARSLGVSKQYVRKVVEQKTPVLRECIEGEE